MQKIIDAHVHLIQNIAGTGADGELRYIGNGMAQYASGKTIRALPEEYVKGYVTAEDLLVQMNRNNVEKAVLLQGNYFGFQNLYSVAAQNRYPDRFRAAGAYDPYSRGKYEIRKNLFELNGLGIVKFELSTGSGLMCNHPTFPIDGDVMSEEFNYCDEHGLVCVMDIGKCKAESWQVDAVRSVVTEHPSVQFVLCHLLAPSSQNAAYMLEQLPKLVLDNVFFDLAALPHNLCPGAYPYEEAVWCLKKAMNVVGPDKILFGSDIPSTMKEDSYAHLIDYIRNCAELSDAEKQCILYDNAQKLYFS